MILSRVSLKNILHPAVQVPQDAVFDLPEKVLQFGTGVLLRGLPDYFIDRANRKGIFNGRVIVVKSTDGGDSSAFERQDGLYTLCVRGLEGGRTVSENIINASISRVLSAKTQWDAILRCAHLPELKVIISNTTEVGIQLVNESINQHPPQSFPAKLLAFLYERCKAFNGSKDSGMVIVPTELIVDNGKRLAAIVMELAHLNDLPRAFIDWLQTSNYFCSSLVDRIVPGKPNARQKEEWEKEFGYNDELMTVSESYRLWAIEGNDQVRSVLSFASADEGVIIAPEIGLFRELKLRLLNGTHTVCCGPAFLSGIDTVKQALDSRWMSKVVEHIMLDEIAQAIPYPIDQKAKSEFADKVLDRFRNSAIEHYWINITMQYTSKLRMRVVPVLRRYYDLYQIAPAYITAGFSAWLLFMRVVKKEGDAYFGEYEGREYRINDDAAEILYQYWQQHPDASDLDLVFSNNNLWGDDLSKLAGFTKAVKEYLQQMLDIGVDKTIQSIQLKKVVA